MFTWWWFMLKLLASFCYINVVIQLGKEAVGESEGKGNQCF